MKYYIPSGTEVTIRNEGEWGIDVTTEREVVFDDNDVRLHNVRARRYVFNIPSENRWNKGILIVMDEDISIIED